MQLPPVELAAYFPYLPVDGSMSEEERLEHVSALYRESEKIKKKFTAFMFNLQKDLEKNSKLEDIINLLVFYDKALAGKLSNSNSIALVFRNIRQYVSFFDYELLKVLAKHLGSSELKKKLVKYKMSFQEFAKRHICECPTDVFGDSESTDEKVYVIKIDRSMEDLTLEELKTLQRKMNEILGQRFLKPLKVQDGCVQVTFQTFHDNKLIITAKQQQALSKLGILNITCGSEFIDISAVSMTGLGKSLK